LQEYPEHVNRGVLVRITKEDEKHVFYSTLLEKHSNSLISTPDHARVEVTVLLVPKRREENYPFHYEAFETDPGSESCMSAVV
jgi:hypothetical protein